MLLIRRSPRWLSGKEPACQCRRCRFDPLGWEDSLGKEMATHSSILAWEIPWTEEPGGLYSMKLQRVRHNGITEHAQLLYNAVLVSATQHSESALSIHMSPPSQTSLPFPTPQSLLITILEMIIYTPLCVCVCVCTPFWWLRRYRICLQ